MTLGELVEALEAADPDLTVPEGIGNPHSYRGYYDELAFEPVANVTVRQMLADARSAVGATYEGWKGGEFLMNEYTQCHIAVEGTTGEGIGPVLLRYMLAVAQPQPAPDLGTAWRLLEEARALLDHETRLTWQSGLPGERARVAVVRESAGLEAL